MPEIVPNPYPILEFDATPTAVIDPGRVIQADDVPEHCVVCCFPDINTRLYQEGRARIIPCQRNAVRRPPICELEIQGRRLAVFSPGIGAPVAAALLEEVIALGCRKFIACGSAGILDKEKTAGRIIVPSAAVRDEGTSYHYLPPGREVAAHPVGVAAIEKVLQEHHCDYVLGKTWTTDALYRETSARVQLRRSEGCLAVEMEAAALLAVARFRGVVLALILLGQDDISGGDWDPRPDQNQAARREQLFWLAAEACLAL